MYYGIWSLTCMVAPVAFHPLLWDVEIGKWSIFRLSFDLITCLWTRRSPLSKQFVLSSDIFVKVKNILSHVCLSLRFCGDHVMDSSHDFLEPEHRRVNILLLPWPPMASLSPSDCFEYLASAEKRATEFVITSLVTWPREFWPFCLHNGLQSTFLSKVWIGLRFWT